jgi:very-short-patch-repair endonuclease
MSDGVQALLTHIRQVGLPEPQTEIVFHPTRKWRFDLAYPEQMIAIEVEGAVYARGRHTRGEGYEGDCEKYNEAQRLGWKVYRFSTGQVLKGKAVKFLEQVIREA